MYREYYDLTEKPFENTPDPKFLYRSYQHEEGLSRLLWCIQERKGAGLLTGIFGCGKTVLARALLRELNLNIFQVCLINNPYLKSVELLRAIARSLGAETLPEKLSDMSKDYFLEVINNILMNNLKDGKETLIIIDEAHVITDLEVYEELRLLLNFQLENRFLLTLILMGQPELLERIHKNKQLSQRIALGYHLNPLSEEETKNYIYHRLKIAGSKKEIFTLEGIKLIYQNSGGIPRRINQICDLALLTGFGQQKENIDENIIQETVASLGV